MFGTSGNLSIKVADRPLTIAVTPTSVDKGELTPRDIVIVNNQGRFSTTPRGTRSSGRTVPDLRPSAETAIHLALYASFPQCGAVFHVHTVHSTLVGTYCAKGGVVTFDGLEMLKGFQTLAPGARPQIPVFPNVDNLTEFAANVAANAAVLRDVPGFLIAHHGMTAWGATPAEAEKHLELLEFLCRYRWEAQRGVV